MLWPSQWKLALFKYYPSIIQICLVSREDWELWEINHQDQSSVLAEGRDKEIRIGIENVLYTVRSYYIFIKRLLLRNEMLFKIFTILFDKYYYFHITEEKTKLQKKQKKERSNAFSQEIMTLESAILSSVGIK